MKKFFAFILETLKTLFFVALVVIPIRCFIFQPFLVSGASMEPTFSSGEYLLIEEVTYYFREPKRGEVVVFRAPLAPSYYFIKRIIGLPGETVKIDEGKVYIYNLDWPHGKMLLEPYAQKTITGNLTIDLNRDEYFVLGDNRSSSADSRSWGPLPRKNIIGKVWISLSFRKGFQLFQAPVY